MPAVHRNCTRARATQRMHRQGLRRALRLGHPLRPVGVLRDWLAPRGWTGHTLDDAALAPCWISDYMAGGVVLPASAPLITGFTWFDEEHPPPWLSPKSGGP